MRENAAMPGGADNQRASAASLLPIAFAAAAVLVLALLISGGRTGSIVVQRVVEPISRINGPQTQISFMTVTETSASGTMTRLLVAGSFGDSAARRYGSSIVGDTIETYVPTRHTIYVMSDSSYEAATKAYFARRFPHASVRTVPLSSYAGSWLAPGRTSFFKIQLQRGNYQLAGQTRIDGRRALKLVPTPGRGSIAFARQSPGEMALQPAYVSPGSYDPIEERSNGTVRDLWTEYRVLPATNTNQRFLSLTAAYPDAHVSYSAAAYVQAAFGSIR
jgi:hypothetical protein